METGPGGSKEEPEVGREAEMEEEELGEEDVGAKVIRKQKRM